MNRNSKQPPTTSAIISIRKKLGLSTTNTPTSTIETTTSSQPRDISTTTPSLILPKVVGHRGALYQHLENTRPGFLQCAEWKCHGVELDVFWLQQDDSLVVFHGCDSPRSISNLEDDSDNLQSSTQRPGLLQGYCRNHNNRSILDLNYQETQQLEFDPDFDEFPCDKTAIQQGQIPLLKNVLQDLASFSNFHIKIELKGPDTVNPVLHLVESMQMQSQCSYSSFDVDQMKQLRRLRPDRSLYPSGLLLDGEPPQNYIELAQNHCGVTEIHLLYDECTVERVQQIHQAGLQCMAWFRGPCGMRMDAQTKYSDIGSDGENEFCYQAVVDTGVDQICCNRPDLLMTLLSKQGVH